MRITVLPPILAAIVPAALAVVVLVWILQVITIIAAAAVLPAMFMQRVRAAHAHAIAGILVRGRHVHAPLAVQG